MASKRDSNQKQNGNGGYKTRFGRSKLKRNDATRSEKVKYVIATEGAETEREYFRLVRNICIREGLNALIDIELVPKSKKHRSAPDQVLQCMEKYLREKQHRLEKNDEAWLVLDHDSRPESAFAASLEWTKKKPKQHFLAVSTPCLEQWLLWHYRNTTGIAKTVRNELSKECPDFKTNLPTSKFTQQTILRAVGIAKKRDNPQCSDWPRTNGSTLYRLMEKIFKSLERE